ncbi:ankyrin repeat domain-containing protein [Wolbachia endosymbiont (group B) of Euphydryas aurinia]|uniref:ankyrin repeat domain-containing protein n=1 Tax=Wolbachia endosymbiont (group B) of Euphydryas aurinia TaxID=2954014 RepID=UPI002227A6E5|nr:ankyrin repeat domain-containing protein [Wolbachia endosymbiont (group B) of Euphydryas aurinia]
MHMDQQQSSNSTINRVIQLLQSSVLKQKNLSDKVSDAEVSRLIDDTVKLSRSKRSKKGRKGSNKQHVRNKWNAKKNREKAREIVGEAVDYFDGYEDQLIYNRTSQGAITRGSQTAMSLEQLNLELINSVKQSNLNKVKEYINEGADISTKDNHGKTPLHIAAKRGLLDIAKFLLDKGADIDAQENKFGRAPLHLAAAKGHLDIVKYLIEKGADVDVYQGGWSYSTALHLAARKGHLDIVKYLIEKGANPKATDSEGKNPLQRAAQSGHSDIVEYLKKSVQQVTQVQSATERQNITTKIPPVTKEQQVNDNKTLQESATQNSQISTSGTNKKGAIQQQVTTEMSQVTGEKQFAEEQQSDFIQETLEALSDFLPDFRGELSKTLKRLFETSKEQVIEGQNITTGTSKVIDRQNTTTEIPQVTERQNITIVTPLVTEGQNVTEMSRVTGRQNVTIEVPQVTKAQNVTTEMPVVTERQNVTVEVLPVTEVQNVTTEIQPVTEEQKMTEKYSNGSLHLGAEQGDLDMVKYFVEKGAEVNAKANDYLAPLQVAAIKGYLDIAKYLIDNGADVNIKTKIKNNKIVMPLHLALDYSNTPFGYGRENHAKIAKYLINNGADINVKGTITDTTPLHLATDAGKLDVVKLLVDKGADIRAKDRDGHMPIHIAVKNAHRIGLDMVKFFLNKGIDVNTKDGDNYTLLRLASIVEGVKHENLVKFLIEQGASVNHEENNGWSPLYWLVG